jgi:hypothetical protein
VCSYRHVSDPSMQPGRWMVAKNRIDLGSGSRGVADVLCTPDDKHSEIRTFDDS